MDIIYLHIYNALSSTHLLTQTVKSSGSVRFISTVTLWRWKKQHSHKQPLSVLMLPITSSNLPAQQKCTVVPVTSPLWIITDGIHQWWIVMNPRSGVDLFIHFNIYNWFCSIGRTQSWILYYHVWRTNFNPWHCPTVQWSHWTPMCRVR